MVFSGSHILLPPRGRRKTSSWLWCKSTPTPASSSSKAPADSILDRARFSFRLHVAAPRWVCCFDKHGPSQRCERREGEGKGKKTAREVAARCEWRSSPWGDDGASGSPQTQTLLLSQNNNKKKKNPHANNRKRRTKRGKTNKPSRTRRPHTQHTHSAGEKHTRWNSVSTEIRQACSRNQTNSNDFPAPLPYKGIGTPSKKFSWWLQLSLLLPGPDSI